MENSHDDKHEAPIPDEVEMELDRIYKEMQKPKHREATRKFLEATAEDLNASYRQESYRIEASGANDGLGKS